jgi:FkbM family methyltransferase
MIECLASVRNLNYSNYLTVVVDNSSTDGSVERKGHGPWHNEKDPVPFANVAGGLAGMNFFAKLTYHPRVLRLVWALRLRVILRKLFYLAERPRDGILQIDVLGTSAKFYVRSPGELRLLQKAGIGYFEHPVMEFLKEKLSAGDVVYDVGSNIGLYAVLLGKLVGEKGLVIGFEPEQKNYDHLLQNLSLNSLNHVHIYRVALGDCDGEGKLYSGEDPVLANLLNPREKEAGYEVVKIREGDSFRRAENLPVPRAIKIDVEGYEYSVLKGLKETLQSPACQFVSCEVHPTLLPKGVTPEEVLGLLRSCGFSQISKKDEAAGMSEYHALASKA